MEKVRIGLIGCGGIAHGKHLPALKKQPEVELTAFCDIEVERAVRAAEQYGDVGAKSFLDYRELITSGLVDAVNICTPNSSHAQIAIDAMEAGLHVLTEKPMAKTVADARAMLETSRRTGKLLTVGYQSRFRADSQYLKTIITEGELGDIYMAKAHAVRRRAVPTWGVFLDAEKQGGGPLIDIGTHALDLTLWLMDNYEVASVTGSVFRKLADRENAANAWGSWDPKIYTVEDSAFGFIKMKNGATIFLESSWALNARETDEAKCTLFGSEAGADMKDGLWINGEKHGKLYTNEIQLGGKGVAFYDATPERPENTEMAVFVSAILHGTPLTILPEQACVVSEVLEAIYRSAETGQTITF